MEQAGPEAQHDGDSYNFVIALCALDKRIARALKHMQSMYEQGFVPSKTTYNELLGACA
jgi:pentatricopeptide repeat protein